MMVNGTAVDPGGDDALSDGDEFTILPAMAGGSDEIKRGACAG
jgi:molybdopterin converting factor small subunit